MHFHPDFMPFTPRKRPSLRAAASNMIENWPPQAYLDDYAIMDGIWPILPKTLLLTNPELISEVLIENPEKFMRDRFQTRALSNIVNRQSIFFAEGGDWRWQRRAVSPAFRHEKLLALTPTFVQCAGTLVNEWRHKASGTVVDVAPAMSRVTFNIILRAVLGAGAQDFARDKFLAAINPSLSTIAWRFLYARIGAPEFLPFPGAGRVAESVDWLHGALSALVARRCESAGDGADILGLLLSARDPETGRVMSAGELVSNLYTFMIAGHETSATALAWTLWLLAHDQTSQDRLRNEIDAVFGQRDIVSEEIEKLIFARQILQESMRLFPPAIGVGRAPLEDIEIGGHPVHAGELVIIAGWCVHRHDKLWEQPQGFDPERFAQEKAKARHRCAYLPFGAGPRICIGMNFAMLEMIVILATLVRAFRFSLLPGHRIKLATNLTLRAENGLPLKIDAT